MEGEERLLAVYNLSLTESVLRWVLVCPHRPNVENVAKILYETNCGSMNDTSVLEKSLLRSTLQIMIVQMIDDSVKRSVALLPRMFTLYFFKKIK